MKPKIIISPRIEQNKNRRLYNNDDYFLALKKSLVFMPALVDEETANQLAKEYDGLLITGGYDVSPEMYNENNTKSTDYDKTLDLSDIYLFNAFHREGKPILGICRGLQLINVALGGSLIQDIPSDTDSTISHSDSNVASHQISVYPDTLLSTLLEDKTIVNSYHHQAIKELAPTLIISARSADSIIEAVEGENILALQWHPERMLADENQRQLFEWLISKATKK
jgi:Predicted glutamine amidotransferases